MKIEHYIITFITIILTCLNYRTRGVLNNISESITDDKYERNMYEIVMQPKWLLNSSWLLTILWIYLAFLLFQLKGWWGLLYTIGYFFSVAFISKLLPAPSLRSVVALFYSTVNKRLANESKYTISEIRYLKIAKTKLDKAINPNKHL